MYTIRMTQPLLRRMKTDAARGSITLAADTSLGDWFIKPYNFGRQRLLLCTSSGALITVLVPAANLRALPARLKDAVGQLLYDIGAPLAAINAELSVMQESTFDRTNSRVVLGWMNEMAYMSDAYMTPESSAAHRAVVAYKLSEVPAKPLKYSSPRDAALRLLEKWTSTRAAPHSSWTPGFFDRLAKPLAMLTDFEQ